MSGKWEEYFKASFEEKLLISMPERADKYLTPATRLLEKRREILEMEQALSTQKEEFQLQMESVKQRREQLDRKKHELKESLLKFDKFLKENDSKRARAIKKMTDEREAKRGKEREIEKLEEEMRQLIKTRDKIQKKAEKYSVCQRYLDKIIEISDEFQELREITARYDTLINTHNELLARENKHQDDIENEKSKLSKFVEKKNNEMLSYNNQLAQLQTELEKEQSNALKWESEWTHIQNTAAKKTLLLGKIKMATHNLFQLINKNAKEAETVESTVEQLNKIQTFIQDLSQITNEIKRSENLNII
ncbi:coiled-coil domain-containing protein 42 homolog isoform X1 [Hydra vulgaris]|nr:coiled-coil domain-containing protein 42 homolog [Hydra vulgaris]